MDLRQTTCSQRSLSAGGVVMLSIRRKEPCRRNVVVFDDDPVARMCQYRFAQRPADGMVVDQNVVRRTPVIAIQPERRGDILVGFVKLGGQNPDLIPRRTQ